MSGTTQDKTVIFLMGASGSGKSYLEKKLTSGPDFYKVVSVTTRDIRDGEVDGVDYHYISDDEYDDLVANDKLIQVTSFAGNRYGTLRAEYTTDERYATLVAVPSSVDTFIPVLLNEFPHYKIANIYFDITYEKLMANMRKRGDTEEMIVKRLMQDDLEQQMKDASFDADYIVRDDDLVPELDEHVMKWLSFR